MAVTLPKLEIIFKQLATSLIQRSQRGIAVLIVRDDTDETVLATYQDITQVEADADKYTAANLQYIRDVFAFAPFKVVVVRSGADVETSIADALPEILSHVKTGWITVADGTSADNAALSSWVKSQELLNKTYKAVVYQTSGPDCKHIVNFANDSVTFADARGEQPGQAYCPSLAGILAGANIRRGTTSYVCANLVSVAEVADNETAVGSGKFILINDDDQVRVAVGIDSLITLNGITATEDMQYIETVEAMDLIADDVGQTFKNEYRGNYRNSYDNQVLFISAVNGYFASLAAPEVGVLDNGYDNRAGVDVEAQRLAWVSSGKPEAAGWDDATVKQMTFKRSLFLAGDIKILGSMENLSLVITLA